MKTTFTAHELSVIRLGLEGVADRFSGTDTGKTARDLLARVSEAERAIRDHGAVEASL